MTAAVLVHGLSGTRASLAPVADALRAAGVHVQLPLLPGHETVPEDLARVRWQDWAAVVDEAVSEAAGNGPVTILGISMGGALALQAAANRHEIRRVILVNPSLTFRHPLLPLLPMLKYVVRSMPNGRQVRDPAVEYAGYPRVPTAAVDQMRRLWREVARRLPEVGQPLLVFRSLADGEAGERSTRLALDHVGSASTEEVLLERSGHVATLDYDGHLIAQRVVDEVCAVR